MKLIIKSEKNTFLEEINIDEEKEHFDECVKNGANPHLEKITFEHYSRPVKDTLSNIHKYKGRYLCSTLQSL